MSDEHFLRHRDHHAPSAREKLHAATLGIKQQKQTFALMADFLQSVEGFARHLPQDQPPLSTEHREAIAKAAQIAQNMAKHLGDHAFSITPDERNTLLQLPTHLQPVLEAAKTLASPPSQKPSELEKDPEIIDMQQLQADMQKLHTDLKQVANIPPTLQEQQTHTQIIRQKAAEIIVKNMDVVVLEPLQANKKLLNTLASKASSQTQPKHSPVTPVSFRG